MAARLIKKERKNAKFSNYDKNNIPFWSISGISPEKSDKRNAQKKYTVKQPKTLNGLELDGDDVIVVDVRDMDDWKEQIGQRKDANYVPIETYVSCSTTLPRREILERAKINAEYLEKTIKKCGCGKNGMALSKKEYKKEIKAEADILLKDAYGNEIRQIGLLKAALLNQRHRPTRCLAMKYELENGYLLQRLLVNRGGGGSLKTVEEAVEAVEDFLWF